MAALTVVRRYQPEAAALDDLIEALYRLIMDVPTAETAAPESPCFSSRHE